MTERELRNRLRAMAGDIPAETHAVFLSASSGKKEEKRMKRKFTASLALALILMLVTIGAAYAATEWDIVALLDIWQPRTPAEDDPTEDFSGEKTYGETKLASFRVQQAYHDGQNMYAIIEIKPSSPDTVVLAVPLELEQILLFRNYQVAGYDESTFFLNPGNERQFPMSALGPEFADSQQTLGEFMDENGKTKIIYAFATLSVSQEDTDVLAQTGHVAYDWALQKDGSLLLKRSVECMAVNESVACGVNCFVDPSYHKGGYDWTQYTEGENAAHLSFTVKANEASGQVWVEGPITFPGQEGYQADWVSVSATPFGLDISVSWRFPVRKLTKFEKERGDLIFEPAHVYIRVDYRHTSNRLNSTYSRDLSSSWALENPECYGVQHVYFPDLTTLPEVIYLECGDQQQAVRLTGEQ